MKNFFLIKIIRYFVQRINGYKTIFGGIGMISLGVMNAVALINPDDPVMNPMQLSPTVEMTVGYFTGAFALWGVGGKLEKIKKEVGNK